MTLSPASPAARATSRVNVADSDVCALGCAVSAGVHGALVQPHAEESTRLAVAFLLGAVALGMAAVAMALDPTPAVSGAVAILLLAVAAAYLLSRTTGISGLTQHQEPFDVLGVVISSLELVAAVVAVRHANPRRHR